MDSCRLNQISCNKKINILNDHTKISYLAAATEKLRAQIQADQLEPRFFLPSAATDSPPSLQNTLEHLRHFDGILSQTRQEIQQEIQRIESSLYETKEQKLENRE